MRKRALRSYNIKVRLGKKETRESAFLSSGNAAYLLGGDHDANLLDCFGELLGLDGAVVVKIEVLESLHQDGFLALCAAGLLCKFVFKFPLETEELYVAYLALSDSICC